MAAQWEALDRPPEALALLEGLMDALPEGFSREGVVLPPGLLADALTQTALVRLAYAAPHILRHLTRHPTWLTLGVLSSLTPTSNTDPDSNPDVVSSQPASESVASEPAISGPVSSEFNSSFPPEDPVSQQVARWASTLLPLQSWLPQESSPSTDPAAESDLIRLEPETFLRVVRHWKYANLTRLTAQSLLGAHTPRQTCGRLTALAQGMVRLVYAHSFARQVITQGLPWDGQGLSAGVVAGMGKLGGGELNYSSDVDVIFLHEGSGENLRRLPEGFALPPLTPDLAVDDRPWWAALDDTARQAAEEQWPEGSQDTGDFHQRVCRRTVSLLSQTGAEGFGLRVDPDLRPQGKSGLLCPSLAYALQYYEVEGREWERTALLKARRAAGHPRVWAPFHLAMRPFVFRRYLDYSAIEGLVLVKRDINRHHQGSLAANVKLGRGGIRENEFFVQAQQLLHGGRNPALQMTGHQGTLEELARAGVMTPADAAEHLADYWHLRGVENRLQMVEESQTQELPADGERLARVLHDFQPGFSARLAGALNTLEETRKRVESRFKGLLAMEEAEEQGGSDWRRMVEEQSAQGGSGSQSSEELLRRADEFLDQLMKTRAGERCIPKVERLLARPHLHLRGSDPVFPRWLEFLERIGNRNAIFVLLESNPSIVAWVSRVFAEGGALAGQLIRHPEFLETYVGTRPLTPQHIRQEVLEAASRAEDEEGLMLELQTIKAHLSIRILAAYLDAFQNKEGWIDHHPLLAALADAAIEACLAFAWDSLTRRHGYPEGVGPEDGPANSGFCVMALGKLGSRDMRFSSDLDLVFFHQAEGTTTDGTPHSEFFAKLARKVSTLLTSQTQFGVLYALDHRLRPYGGKGVLVPPLAAMENFLARQAEVWNFQAFTRLRHGAGDPRLSARVAGAVQAAWQARGLTASELAGQVRHMLDRLVEEHMPPAAREGRAVALKFAPGGLIGYEFLRQLALLRALWRGDAAWIPAENGGGSPEVLPPRLPAGAPERAWVDPLTPLYQTLAAVDERLACHLGADDHLALPEHFSTIRAVGETWNWEQLQEVSRRLAQGVEDGFKQLAKD